MTDLFNLLDISPKANSIDYLLLLDGSLRRRDAGDRHAERRTAYIVHTKVGAELD